MTLAYPMPRAEPEARPFRKAMPQLPPGNSFLRIITAQAKAYVQHAPALEIASKLWPWDQAAIHVLERAATAPAMTTVTGWAAELAQKVIYDALDALAPVSAAAEIFRRSTMLSFDGAASISVPGFVAEFGNAGFVAEGQPIPVRQFAVSGPLLNPHKLAAIGVLTREMIESSNAERLIADVLTRAAGRMLDEVLFDANPGDAARPPGLRYGVSATTPSNNATASEAYFEDIAALLNAISPVLANGHVILVASPGRAAQMAIRDLGQAKNITVLGSNAVINDVLAIAPNALVAAGDANPDVETSKAASLHMDSAPSLDVGSAGAHRSLFQTDTLALKMRWPITWAIRDARGFAWMTPTWKAVMPT